MGQLKSCPFCGGNALGPTDAWPHMIICEKCGGSVKGFSEEGEKEAIEKWNRRVCYATKMTGWISVEDDLPKQHKSIFAPWYGTEMWNAAMWKEESDTVIVAGRFPDGTKTTTTGKLCDGKWTTRISKVLNFVVTHWMPMPEPPEGG